MLPTLPGNSGSPKLFKCYIVYFSSIGIIISKPYKGIKDIMG